MSPTLRPHWPLHAHDEDIERYDGRFAAGWDQLREERLQRMRDMGILDEGWALTDRDPTQPAWEEAEHKAWNQRRMEVYAAQIDRMDQGVGRIRGGVGGDGSVGQHADSFLS